MYIYINDIWLQIATYDIYMNVNTFILIQYVDYVIDK